MYKRQGVNGQLGKEVRIASKNTIDDYIFTNMNEVEGLDTTYLDIDAIRKLANRKSLLKAEASYHSYSLVAFRVRKELLQDHA